MQFVTSRCRWLFVLAFGSGVACTGSIGGAGRTTGETTSVGGDGGGTGRGGAGMGVNTGGGAGGSPAALGLPATTRFARLAHRQWENTVQDLLRLASPPGLAENFIGDASPGLFNNEGGTLEVTNQLWSDYETAAEAMAAKVAGDPQLLAAITPANLPTDAAGKARGFVVGFGARAFRRPLSSDEITRYLGIFNQGPTLVGSGDAFADGVRMVIETMLQSPYFLYRTELGTTAVGGRIALDDNEIASKLSYTIVGSMPDETLFASAAAHGLSGNATAVRAQAQRLLGSDAGKATMDDFHTQVLRLAGYDAIDKDPQAFPLFVAGIGADMRQETLLFSRDVIFAQQGGLRELLTSPTTFVNKRTAPIYGVSGSFGDAFTKVSLDTKQRAGWLTQLGFLSVNAYRNEIDSIHRGVFVHRMILCTNLPPPLPNVTPVPATGGVTNRERVDAHTGKGTCGESCHGTFINPAGFAFEEYDALGAYRTTDNGEMVDSTGSLTLGGQTVSWKDAVGFSQVVADSAEAHACYASHLLEYLHGRRPVDQDQPTIDRIGDESRAQHAPVTTLVLDLVSADSFLYRAP